MQLNEILSKANRLDLVAECNLNNTLSVPWTYDDWNCGFVENCGQDKETHFVSNSDVKISNNQINGQSTSVVMTGGFSVTSSLPQPLEGSNVTVSYAPLSILNIDSVDSFRERRFKDSAVVIKAGGLIDKGKPTEQELDYSDFEPWIEGVFVGDDKTDESIDLNIGLKSDELNYLFPSRTYDSGIAEGQAIPVVYGVAKGIPVDLGGGIRQFHDGLVDLDNDNPTDLDRLFPMVSVGEDVDYWHDLRFGKLPETSSGGATAIKSDFDWAVDGQNRATSSDGPELELSTSDNLEIEGFNNNELQISLKSTNISRYTSSGFRWTYQGNGQLLNSGGVGFSATLSTGLIFRVANARYFKFSTSSSGKVTINAPSGKKISSCELIIRSIDVNVQTIDNWSHQPSSIVPRFTSTNENHLVTFENINDDSISFDYTCTNPGQEVAVWFQQVSLYEPQSCQLVITTGDTSSNINVGLGFSDASQKVVQSLPAYVSAPPNQIGINTFTIQNDTKSIVVDLEVGLGGFTFFIDSIDYVAEDAGVTYESGVITITPAPPPGGGVLGDLYGVFSELYALDGPYSNPIEAIATRYLITFTASLESNVIDSALCSVISGGSSVNPNFIFDVGKSERDYVFEVFSRDLTPLGFDNTQLSLCTWRGEVETVPGIFPNRVNPNEDFTVKIKGLRVIPSERVLNDVVIESEIKIYDDSGDDRVELPTYQVANAHNYKDRLPRGIALFDNRGRSATSSKHQKVSGLFKGSDSEIKSIAAFKDMAMQASGDDLVSANFDGDRVGIMIKDQKPWIDHVAYYCNGADYFYRENLVGSGITISERYDYLSFPNESRIPEEPIIVGTITEIDQPKRMSQLIVEYQIDESDPNRTLRVKSDVVGTSRSAPTIVESPFFEREKNQEIANRILRQSVYAQQFEGELALVGFGIEEGQARFIDSPKVPANRPCVIDEVTQQVNVSGQIDKTILKFTVYNGSAIHG